MTTIKVISEIKFDRELSKADKQVFIRILEDAIKKTASSFDNILTNDEWSRKHVRVEEAG